MPSTYRLADCPAAAETGGMSFDERFSRRTLAAVKTGGFRCPKRGEWYLSGATPEAYKAPNDLTGKFHILALVKVDRKTVVVETVTPL